MIRTRLSETLRDIGHAAFLWNRIQAQWFMIFGCLLKNTPAPAVKAIYHQFSNDTQQRKLILAVADAVLTQDDGNRQRIKRLFEKTNDASGYRNSLFHAQFHLSGQSAGGVGFIDIQIGDDPTTKRPNKLKFKQLRDELPPLISQIHELERELEVLRIDLDGTVIDPQTLRETDLLARILKQEEAGERQFHPRLTPKPDSEPPA